MHRKVAAGDGSGRVFKFSLIPVPAMPRSPTLHERLHKFKYAGEFVKGPIEPNPFAIVKEGHQSTGAAVDNALSFKNVSRTSLVRG